jgi:hypothetical protein
MPNASGYYSYFGSIAGNPSLGYYSYDIGTWHLIALNSNCPTGTGWRPGGYAAGSAQEQWLRQDLAPPLAIRPAMAATAPSWRTSGRTCTPPGPTWC